MPERPLHILLTGSNGQVGRALQKTLAPLGRVIALNRAALDLADHDAIRGTVREYRPGLIVNAAAYTAVDRAESEPDLAMAVNGTAPGILGEEARRLDAVLLHYSTDYVFDGTKATAYTEADTPNPLNVYGRTKLAGEEAIRASGAMHYILRTSWVYAAEGANFLNTILRLARERPELRIVNDQTGAPTSATAVAEMSAAMLRRGLANPGQMPHGLYHVTAAGSVTWFGFAQEILAGAEKLSGLPRPRVVPIATRDYPFPAQRPRNSVLSTDHFAETSGITPEPWQSMLVRCLQEKFSDSGG